MNVLEEKAVKKQNEMSRRGINLYYFFFWISFYQLVCTGLMFWVDIIPWFGNACSIQDFGVKYVYPVYLKTVFPKLLRCFSAYFVYNIIAWEY